MISGGYRCPLYDDDAAVTTTDLGSDQATRQLDSACAEAFHGAFALPGRLVRVLRRLFRYLDWHRQVVDLVWWLRGLVVVAIAARYKGYRYPIEVIGHAVWLYHRFALSLRDVEEASSSYLGMLVAQSM